MAKDRTSEDRETRPVATYVDFADKLRTIADQREITMAEALDRFCGVSLQREYKRVVEEMHANVLGESGA
jgi:malate/lactate dehydrogenase